MKKWAIQLSGHQYDLEFLDQNHYSPDWSIVIDNKEYFLVSSTFNLMTDKDEVKKEAEKLIRSINGNAMLANNDYKPVVFAGISKFDKQGNRVYKYIEITEKIRMIDGVDVYNEGESKNDDTKESKLMKSYSIIAENNDYFSNAIDILGKGKEHLEYGDLYNILDLLEDSRDKKRVFEKFDPGFAKEISDLSLICQSYKAAGEEARHRKSSFDKKFDESKIVPKDKAEYIELIRRLLAKWAEILDS